MSTTQTRRPRVPGAPSAQSASTEQPPNDDQAATSAASTSLADVTQPPSDELPNAIDIDPKTIRGPVLTKQGWVCPDETGRRPLDAMRL